MYENEVNDLAKAIFISVVDLSDGPAGQRRSAERAFMAAREFISVMHDEDDEFSDLMGDEAEGLMAGGDGSEKLTLETVLCCNCNTELNSPMYSQRRGYLGDCPSCGGNVSGYIAPAPTRE